MFRNENDRLDRIKRSIDLNQNTRNEQNITIANTVFNTTIKHNWTRNWAAEIEQCVKIIDKCIADNINLKNL